MDGAIWQVIENDNTKLICDYKIVARDANNFFYKRNIMCQHRMKNKAALKCKLVLYFFLHPWHEWNRTAVYMLAVCMNYLYVLCAFVYY